MTAAGKTAERAADAARPAGLARVRKPIGYWLFAMCGMVFIMVIIGGVTRLTESGLSIVDWRPVTGWLPPMSDAAWLALFEAYKQTPEFLKINTQMDVEGFKGIFWLEYIHRLWGRLLGIAFAVPFLYFLVKTLGRPASRLAAGIVLRAWRGARCIGLVHGQERSGGRSRCQPVPADRPSRTRHRHLRRHVLDRARSGGGAQRAAGPSRAYLRRLSAVILGWVFVTMLSGGFVAGLNAGKTYNTFPLMDGKWIPDGLFLQDPAWRNFFENVTTVQFDHRVLATGALLLIAVTWALALRARLSPPETARFHLLAGVGLLQVVLGISTLLLVVPVFPRRDPSGICTRAIDGRHAGGLVWQAGQGRHFLTLRTAFTKVAGRHSPGKSAGVRRFATT